MRGGLAREIRSAQATLAMLEGRRHELVEAARNLAPGQDGKWAAEMRKCREAIDEMRGGLARLEARREGKGA